MRALLLVGWAISAAWAQPTSTSSEPGVGEGESPAVAPEPSYIQDRVTEGVRLIGIGRFEEAIAIFDEILARRPGHGQALANRAIAYAWTNRLVEATRDLHAAEAVIPDSAIVYRVRGLIAQRRDDDATAIEELSRSLEREQIAVWRICGWAGSIRPLPITAPRSRRTSGEPTAFTAARWCSSAGAMPRLRRRTAPGRWRSIPE